MKRRESTTTVRTAALFLLDFPSLLRRLRPFLRLLPLRAVLPRLFLVLLVVFDALVLVLEKSLFRLEVCVHLLEARHFYSPPFPVVVEEAAVRAGR